MTSYEIVMAAQTHNYPERLPVNFGCFGCSDFANIGVKSAKNFTPSVEGEDEWGCIWEKTEVENMGQVIGHPFLDKIPKDLSKTKHPDYNDDSRYEDCLKKIEEGHKNDKYISTGIFMLLFERMHSLHGFENTLCDLYTDSSEMERLADHIVDVHLNFIYNLRERFGDKIHGIAGSDDWGTQNAGFISYEMWMDFFYPKYKKIFDTVHDAGYSVGLHSCGKINELIEGMIQAGVDTVNIQQPRALGIKEIGERYREKITFDSLCDIQKTLPTGNLKQIDKDVENLMTHWASKSGGFIFGDYGDNNAIGVTDPKIKLYMYNKFSEWSERIYGNPLPKPNNKKGVF